MNDWETISAELSKPLDKAHVRPPPKGKYGDYIEGWHCIAEANRIFGFDGWSYRVDTLAKTNEGQRGENLAVGYTAMVTVTVGNISRQDVGHGQGHSRNEGDAHDSAVKEAVTDALKRALKSFGNPFGLALYDKSKANVQDTAAIEARAMRDAEAKTLHEDLVVYLNETDDEALDGFSTVHQAALLKLKGANIELFNDIGKQVNGRRAAMENAA